MTTTKKIAHNTAVQIVGKIISTLLGLLAFGMMARHLGTEQFGWYVTAISFLQFVGIMTDFGMTPVTAQMMSEPKFEKKKLFQNLLAFRFFTAIIFLGLAPLLALFFPYEKEIKIAIGFTSISFVAIAMNQVLIGLYQTKLKMYVQAIGEVIGRVGLVVGIFLLIKFGYGYLSIMGAVTVSSLIYTLILWLRGKKETSVGFAWDKEIIIAIIKKMWPIAISIIFNVVYLKGDVVLLSLFVSQSEVGVYGAAYRVLDILTQSAMMLMGVLLPLLAYSWSRGDKAEFKHRFQQSFDSMMLVAVPMLVGTIALSNPIMTLIAGQEFADSSYILAILSVAVFGVYLGAVFGHTAVAIDKQKQTMWIYISNAVITLAGYLIFIPIFGLLGAAWMSVFSELYAGILLFFVIRHYTGHSLKLLNFFKIILASLAMGYAVYISTKVLTDANGYFANWNIFVIIPVAAIVYGFFVYILKVISKETLREIIGKR